VKREHLEFFLDNKGYSLGFRERRPDGNFVAWMINIENDVDEHALIREVHYFRTLDEVAHYVADFGHALEDIKWLNEINPP